MVRNGTLIICHKSYIQVSLRTRLALTCKPLHVHVHGDKLLDVAPHKCKHPWKFAHFT